ncbi:MAG: CcoQ/FixQ family Cbb3-type cytochrome c oxidase assembly chaperone [bacterium]
MKIVINTLEQIGGVEIYPIISLIIFFSLFAAVTYLVLTAKKEYIDEMKNMPFTDGEIHESDNQQY